jgi:hypothetical protein
MQENGDYWDEEDELEDLENKGKLGGSDEVEEEEEGSVLLSEGGNDMSDSYGGHGARVAGADALGEGNEGDGDLHAETQRLLRGQSATQSVIHPSNRPSTVILFFPSCITALPAVSLAPFHPSIHPFSQSASQPACLIRSHCPCLVPIPFPFPLPLPPDAAVRDRIGKGRKVDVRPLSTIVEKLRERRAVAVARWVSAPPPPPSIVAVN